MAASSTALFPRISVGSFMIPGGGYGLRLDRENQGPCVVQPRYGQAMRYDAEIWARAEEMRASGLSDYEIGRRLGIPRSTVYNHFARSGGRSRRPPMAPDAASGGSDLAGLMILGVMLALWWLDHQKAKGRWQRGVPRSPRWQRQMPPEAPA